MGEESKVILHGMWASPYSLRVEMALKFKGIPYEYIEEDLFNKTPSLLRYNPVHKKIPVLVHNGKPICESLLILEYIEETWNNGPSLFPEDPYERAQIRFWVDFIHQKFADTLMTVIKTEGQTHEKALDHVYELLKVLDEGLKNYFPNGIPTVCENGKLNLLDIIAGSVFCPFKATEQVLGIKIIDPDKTPVLFSWVSGLSEITLLKETTPSHEKLVQVTKFCRELALKSSKA
ncbi:hypothetical protein UlMin_008243 [Ulmus minor]